MNPAQLRKWIFLAGLAALLLFWGVPALANLIIDYNWWKEIGQVGTWTEMLWYAIAPVTVGTVAAFIALWIAHNRGLHFAGVRPRDYPLYSQFAPVGLALVAFVFAQLSVDYWTVMRFFGSRRLTLPPMSGKTPYFPGLCPSTCSACPSTHKCSVSSLF